MKIRLILVLGLCILLKQVPAQQNWAAVSCYQPKAIEEINSMFLDSVHNEIILNSAYGNEACNTIYKGVFAYNTSGFHDLDFGLNKFSPNPSTGGNRTLGCIPYDGKTLFGGFFSSVGSDTLKSEAIALWTGTVWDTFPKRCFKYNPSMAGNFAAVSGFIKYEGKLWIYGGFDSLGNVPGKNLYSFDGNNFTSYAIPVVDYYGVKKLISYKNKLIACGPFYSYTPGSISRVAMYDGTSWSSVGNGIWGSLSFVNDMAIYKDTLYIAGSWPQSAGNVSNYIMKWDGSQLRDAGFGSYHGTDAITSLVVFRNRLFALGNYDQAAGQNAYGIAYYENGAWTVPQDNIENSGVRYGVVYNNDLYIAGSFKNINKDTTIRNFARLVCPDFDAASGCISGLSERTLRTRVKLFPNPVQNELKIELENSSTLYLTITNILGEILLSREEFSTSQRVDVSFLPPGVYMVNVNDGTRAFSNKFVKADR